MGGGILNSGTLTLANSTVTSNTAYPEYDFDPESVGGGISNNGTLRILESTISGNFAIKGGGIFNFNGGTVNLINSTVSGNHAYNDYYFGDGSGIFNNGNLVLINGTVSKNRAGYGYGGGLFNSGSAELSNTIVADNVEDNCWGSVASLDHNLTDDDWCTFTEPDDLVVANAMLGPLAENGGPTKTHALLAESPAIDAGSPDCPPPDTDQRGVIRPQGAACDIGAVEYLPEPHHAINVVAGAAFLAMLYWRRNWGLATPLAVRLF